MQAEPIDEPWLHGDRGPIYFATEGEAVGFAAFAEAAIDKARRAK